jgi:hypothetical protein
MTPDGETFNQKMANEFLLKETSSSFADTIKEWMKESGKNSSPGKSALGTLSFPEENWPLQ